MFCANCGAQNPDDAKFCFSCGAAILTGPPAQGAAEEGAAVEAPAPAPAGAAMQAAPIPSAAPAAMPAATPGPNAVGAAAPPMPAGTPAPNPNGAAPLDAQLKKRIILVVSAALALVVVAIIIAAVMVNCSGSGTPNASDLVKADSEKVASSSENLSAVSVYSATYYTPENMKATMSEAGKAFFDENEKAAEKVFDSVKELSPWAIGFFEEKSEANNFENLTIRDIKGKDDPSLATVITYRAPEEMSAEDLLKIAREFTTIDSVMIGGDPTDAALERYGDLIAFYGIGRGPGTITRLRADKLGGVYEVTLYTYSQNELKGDKIDEYVSTFENGVDTFFKTKFSA